MLNVMDKSKVVVVEKFESMGEALIVEALLKGNGVDCALVHDTISSVLPLQTELVEIELTVAEKDVARAMEILSARVDKDDFKEQTGTGAKPKAPRKCACKVKG